MLDFILKNHFFVVSSFIACEEKVSIVEEYDKWSLYLMFLKCYHYLHPMAKFEVECVN
jgi:hypothetical protein